MNTTQFINLLPELLQGLGLTVGASLVCIATSVLWGCLIASLASLISLKLYLRAEHASLPRYLAVFTAANAAGLAVLSAAAALLGLL